MGGGKKKAWSESYQTVISDLELAERRFRLGTKGRKRVQNSVDIAKAHREIMIKIIDALFSTWMTHYTGTDTGSTLTVL